jgi:hypothetical protein
MPDCPHAQLNHNPMHSHGTLSTGFPSVLLSRQSVHVALNAPMHATAAPHVINLLPIQCIYCTAAILLPLSSPLLKPGKCPCRTAWCGPCMARMQAWLHVRVSNCRRHRLGPNVGSVPGLKPDLGLKPAHQQSVATRTWLCRRVYVPIPDLARRQRPWLLFRTRAKTYSHQSMATRTWLRRLICEMISKPFHMMPADSPVSCPSLGTSKTALSSPT